MKPPAKPASAAASTPEGDRIAKVLSRAGVASRREAERMIAAGEVAVNGKVISSPALNVGPKDKITVNGKPLAPPEPARLWLYYKPEGLVTSASDEKGRETVFDHLPEGMPRVMSVGRLDLNSEGLLLLTNDGELKRRLELPSTGWLRKYRVRVKGNPTDPDLEPLRAGITVEGEAFQPMQVVMDRHQGANAWLTVGLREGKNREIRRAMAAIGLTVNRLIRVSYGPFRLNEMQPGDVEEVRPRVLRDQLGLDPAAVEEAPVAKGRRATPAASGRGGAKPAASPAKGAARPQGKVFGAKPARGETGAPAPRGERVGREGAVSGKPGFAKGPGRGDAAKGAADKGAGGRGFASKPFAAKSGGASSGKSAVERKSGGAPPGGARPGGERPAGGARPAGGRPAGGSPAGPGKGPRRG
jgi:23S rRNA pseudouridine2605 synthase